MYSNELYASLKTDFKEYLKSNNPDWSPKTVDTHVIDAFYCKNHPVLPSFEEALANDDCCNKAKDYLLRFLEKNSPNTNYATNANNYFRTLKMLKAFLDENHGGLIKYAGEDCICEPEVYRQVEDIVSGKTDIITAAAYLSKKYNCLTENTFKSDLNGLLRLKKGQPSKWQTNTATAFYFCIKEYEQYGIEELRKILKGYVEEFQRCAKENVKIGKSGHYRVLLGEISKAYDAGIDFSDKIYDGITRNINYEWKYVDFDTKITTARWVELLNDSYIVPDEDRTKLFNLYDYGKEGTCSQLAEEYGESFTDYNGSFSTIAKRVQKATGCNFYVEDGKQKEWSILFYVKNADKEEHGSILLKIRTELEKAISIVRGEAEMDVVESLDVAPTKVNKNYPLNQILYGPPGTGKTYNSVLYAVAICEGISKETLIENLQEEADKYNKGKLENEKKTAYLLALEKYKQLVEEKRIAFITFHQSYGYEEFIEGIKPVIDDDTDSVKYHIEDGAFKEFCLPKEEITNSNDINAIKDDAKVWYLRLGGSWYPELHSKCMENNEIRIGWPSIDYEKEKAVGNKPAGWTQVLHFIEEMQINDIILVPKYKAGSRSTIGWIGLITGNYQDLKDDDKASKTRKVIWLAKEIDFDVKKLNNDRNLNVNSTIYQLSDIKAVDIKDYLKNNADESQGESVSLVDTATDNKVFIIDEINRGNISKIFGELITLIEPSKRLGAAEAMTVKLPYSGDEFGIPNNVYILGTMNTADRSIALMDTALRRRFDFVEMLPETKLLKGVTIEGVNIEKMLETINKRIEFLFDREHTIGHAFFMGLKNGDKLENLNTIFANKIIPLLQEYFYDDYEKIALVLGDNDNHKDASSKFIVEKPEETNLFFGTPDLPEGKKIYRITEKDKWTANSYIGIYSKSLTQSLVTENSTESKQ